jgi:hypothetical protein
MKKRIVSWSLPRFISDFHSNSIMKMTFLQRNSVSSITPFLDVLGVPFLIINDELVLIKNSDSIALKLRTELYFKDTNDYFPNTRFFVNELKRTEFLCKTRLYSELYNFDIHLVSDTAWEYALLSKDITDGLKVRENKYLAIFLAILRIIKKDSDSDITNFHYVKPVNRAIKQHTLVEN